MLTDITLLFWPHKASLKASLTSLRQMLGLKVPKPTSNQDTLTSLWSSPNFLSCPHQNVLKDVTSINYDDSALDRSHWAVFHRFSLFQLTEARAPSPQRLSLQFASLILLRLWWCSGLSLNHSKPRFRKLPLCPDFSRVIHQWDQIWEISVTQRLIMEEMWSYRSFVKVIGDFRF